MRRHRSFILSVTSALALCAGAFAAPPNDDCATPAPISGSGAWNLDDLFSATQSLPGIPGTTKDTWYCWTPTWQGGGGANTRFDLGAGSFLSAEIYTGCGCPTTSTLPIGTITPLTASFIDFQVECGQQYMIRVGAEGPLYPSAAVRSFSIKKLQEATDCPQPVPTSCPDCCGTKPSYDDPIWRNNYSGQVAVMTGNQVGASNQYPVVTIFNLAHPGPLPSPVQSNMWNPVPGLPNSGTPATAFRFSNRDWFKDRMGSVFGVTLDGSGNIYVAHSSMYSELVPGPCGATSQDINSNPATTIGTLPGSSSTSIYRLANGTGAVTVFNLPGGSSNRQDPGLGNLNFDCQYNQFFVSHFGDGRIYRLSSSGTILSAYDHGADRYDNSAAANAIEQPAAQYSTFSRLGERVWAVQRFKNRLFYSVWGQNGDNFCGTNIVGTAPNTIWSIGINGSGDFIAGSRQLELQAPIHPDATVAPEPFVTNANIFIDNQFSSPVSDISFSSDCKMLLAERSAGEPGETNAHRSRALEYVWNGSAWIPTTNYRNSLGFQVGNITLGSQTTGTNTSGGCDYDSAPASTTDPKAGRLWLTADYMDVPQSAQTYGFTGLDRSTPYGTTVQSSIIIDYNSFQTGGDKTSNGDVEIPCVQSCSTINDVKILCNLAGQPPTPNGTYSYTFTFTNNSGQPVQFLLFGNGSGVTPGSIALPTPVPNGGTSAPITVTLTGATPGQQKCFFITFANPNFEQCCRIEHCVDIPSCNCAQVLEARATCDPTGGAGATLNFTIQNLFGGPINELHIFPLPIGGPTTVNPADFFFPNVPQGGTLTLNTNVSGPSGNICFRVSIHLDGEQCCSFVMCVDIPNCNIGTACNDIDFNNDGNIFDPQDIDAFLSVFSEGPCIPATATCDDIDFNNDGGIFDPCDIDSFLLVFSEGPCTPCGL